MDTTIYTKVLAFNKHEYYNLNDLNLKTKEELLEIAKKDPNNCKVYSIKEFQHKLNSFLPYDYLVWHIFI